MIENEDVKIITQELTTENKKYVLAVANALIFSQENNASQKRQPKQTA